jgi:hypothetical protein
VRGSAQGEAAMGCKGLESGALSWQHSYAVKTFSTRQEQSGIGALPCPTQPALTEPNTLLKFEFNTARP